VHQKGHTIFTGGNKIWMAIFCASTQYQVSSKYAAKFWEYNLQLDGQIRTHHEFMYIPK
jgi:hypothetical protein